MHNNKNCFLTRTEITDNWNNIVLPTEEIILTRTSEETCNKKIINPLLDTYRKNIELNISFYEEDKKLKTILEKRLTCIENFVKLTKLLANRPSANEQDENNPFLHTERNTLEQLIRELIQHGEYIQSNRIQLKNYQIPEDHIQPLLFNLIADAFEHLAVLNWNSLVQDPNDPTPDEFYPTCLSVLNAYETRLKYLSAEKECLSNLEMRALCDEKIVSTLNDIDETIWESFYTYHALLPINPVLKIEKELNTVETKSQIHLKSEPVTQKKRLAEDTDQNKNDGSFFKFKKPKLSPTTHATKPQENQRP